MAHQNRRFNLQQFQVAPLYLSNLHSIELTHHGDSLEELLSLLLRVLDGHNTHSNPILRQVVVVELRRETSHGRDTR